MPTASRYSNTRLNSMLYNHNPNCPNENSPHLLSLSLSLLPSIRSLASESIPLNTMSIQSKILSPVYVSSRSNPASFLDSSHVTWSLSPSPDQKPRCALLKQPSHIPSGSMLSRTNHVSCPSASGSTIHQPHHPFALTSWRKNCHFQAYTPASPGYTDTESRECLMLCC